MFLTVVTADRKRLLANRHAFVILHALWVRSADADGWYVGDYLLMPDHAHVFARAGPQACALGLWVKMWKSISSRRIGGVAAPVWQADYFDRYLRSTESYADKWEYVRRNPVRAGLVSHPDAWPFRGCIHRLGEVD